MHHVDEAPAPGGTPRKNSNTTPKQRVLQPLRTGAFYSSAKKPVDGASSGLTSASARPGGTSREAEAMRRLAAAHAGPCTHGQHANASAGSSACLAPTPTKPSGGSGGSSGEHLHMSSTRTVPHAAVWDVSSPTSTLARRGGAPAAAPAVSAASPPNSARIIAKRLFGAGDGPAAAAGSDDAWRADDSCTPTTGTAVAATAPAAASSPHCPQSSARACEELSAPSSAAAAAMAAGTYNDGGEAAAAASAEEADAGGRRPRRAAAANHRFFSDGALRAQSTVRDLTGRSALSTEDDDGRYPAVRRGRFALAMAAAAARQGGQQQGGQQQRVLGLVSKRPRGDRTPVHLRGRARARGLASPGSGGGGGGGGGGYAYADSNSEDDSDGLDDAFRSRGAGRAYSGNTGEVSFLGSFYGPASAAPAEPRSP